MTTENLQITDIQATQSQKEVTANAAHNLLDRAINNSVSIAVSGDFSLSTVQTRQNTIVILTGTPSGAFVVQMPDTNKRSGLSIVNRTGQTCTIDNSVPDSSTPILLLDGFFVTFSYNGTDFFLQGVGLDNNSPVPFSTNFLGLTDTPGSYVALKAVTVNSGGDALVFTDPAEGGGGGGGLGLANLTPIVRGAIAVRDTDWTGKDFRGAGLPIDWQSTLYDTDSFWSGGAPERLTVPAGVTKVELTGQIFILNHTITDFQIIGIRKNGSFFKGGARTSGDTASTATWLNLITGPIEVVEGDWFDLIYSTSSDLSVDVTATMGHLSIRVLESTDSFSLTSVAIAQRPRFRGCVLDNTADVTDLNGTGAGVDLTWNKEVTDTDGFHAGSSAEFIIPEGLGIKRVIVGANIQINNTIVDEFVNIRIINDGVEGVARADSGVSTTIRYMSVVTRPFLVADGAVIKCILEVQTETTVDLDTNSNFWLEVIEFDGASEVPLAYIAVNPQHKGATISISGSPTGDFDPEAEVDQWSVSDVDTLFQPNDTGGPQRFWLGPDFDFVDGDVSVADDEITETAHGFATGEGPFRMTSSGTLPAGLATGTNYWAIKVDADTFKPAASRADAIAGTPIDITAAAGGGTHTIEKAKNLVVPAGISKVRIHANIRVSGITADTNWWTRFFKNGSSIINGAQVRDNSSAAGDPSRTMVSAVVSVSEGDLLTLSMNTPGDDVITLIGSQMSFSIEVVETSLPLDFPGITTYPKFKGALAQISAAQNDVDATGTGYSILWDTDIYDTDNFHDTGTNTDRLTIPTGLGITRVRVGGSFRIDNQTADTWSLVRLYKNGSVLADGGVAELHDTLTNDGFNITSGPLSVVDGDYFTIVIITESDTTIDIRQNEGGFWIEVIETVEATQPPNDYPIFLEGVPAINNLAWATIAARRVSFPDNFAGSVAECITAPSTEVIFDIDVEGTKIGDITFAAAATVGTFDTIGGSVEDVEIGERLSIDTPADLFTGADFMITLKGFRS